MFISGKQESEQTIQFIFEESFYLTREGPLLSNLELGKKIQVQELVRKMLYFWWWNLWEPCMFLQDTWENGYGCSCTLRLHSSVRFSAKKGGPTSSSPTLTMCSYLHLVLARLSTHQTSHSADSAHSWKICIICLIYIPLFSELNYFNTGSEECSTSGRGEGGMQAGAGGWREEGRGEDSVSDRRRVSGNPVLTSQIQLESKNPHCYRKFAKDLKDTESEIRGNLEAFHWGSCNVLVHWKDKLGCICLFLGVCDSLWWQNLSIEIVRAQVLQRFTLLGVVTLCPQAAELILWLSAKLFQEGKAFSFSRLYDDAHILISLV